MNSIEVRRLVLQKYSIPTLIGCFGLVASMAVDAAELNAATDPPSAEIVELNSALVIAEFKLNAMTLMAANGYAAPCELFQAQQHRTALKTQQKQLAESSLSLRISTADRDSGTQHELLISLPGLMSHPATQPFATVRLAIRHDPELDLAQTTLSLDAQRVALHAELTFRQQLLDRLQKIADESAASRNEIQFHKLQEQAITASIAALSPLPVAQIQSRMDKTNSAASIHPAKTHAAAAGQLRRAAVTVLNQATTVQKRLLDVWKHRQQQCKRKIAALQNLPQDDAVTIREIDHETLVAKIADAEVAAIRNELQSIALKRDYVWAVFEETRPVELREFTPVRLTERHQAPADVIESAKRLLEHCSNDRSTEELAAAHTALHAWRLEGLQELFAADNATWLETNKARVELVKSQSAQKLAEEKRRVAGAALSAIRSAQIGTESVEAPE